VPEREEVRARRDQRGIVFGDASAGERRWQERIDLFEAMASSAGPLGPSTPRTSTSVNPASASSAASSAGKWK
jgi:hypothetical protein